MRKDSVEGRIAFTLSFFMLKNKIVHRIIIESLNNLTAGLQSSYQVFREQSLYGKF